MLNNETLWHYLQYYTGMEDDDDDDDDEHDS
jgi:hypothetical protein